MALFYLVVVLVYSVCARQPQHKAIEVREDTQVYTIIGNILDSVGPPLLQVDSSTRYTILKQGNPRAELFDVIRTTGDIHLLQPLDRETICEQEYQCLAKLNIAVNTLTKPVQIFRVDVIIVDVNDHSPTFPNSELNLSIMADSQISTKLSIPAAVDRDMGDNSLINYEVEQSSDTGLFRLEVNSGLDGAPELSLVLKKQLKPDQINCKLTVLAMDKGLPQKTGSMIVYVTFVAVNRPPVFDRSLYTVSVREDLEINSPVISVTASVHHAGEHRQLSYHFDSHTEQFYSNIFSIDAKSGEIFLVEKLDFEDQKMYRVGVDVTDGLSSAHTTIQVSVLDANDNSPVIFVDYLSGQEQAFVSELAHVSHFVAAVRVTDDDSGINAHVTCEMDTNYFQLVNVRPSEFHIILSKQLDYARSSQHTVVLSCEDGGSPKQEVSRELIINVIDENTNAPKFSENKQIVFIFKSTKVGEIVHQVTATDSDVGNNGRVTYSIDPPMEYFTVDPTTGEITYTRSVVDIGVPEIVVVVTARDNGIPSLETKMVLVIRLTWNVKLPKESLFSDNHNVAFKHINVVIVVIVILLTVLISGILVTCICRLKSKRDEVSRNDQSVSEDGRGSPISFISTELMLPPSKV